VTRRNRRHARQGRIGYSRGDRVAILALKGPNLVLLMPAHGSGDAWARELALTVAHEPIVHSVGRGSKGMCSRGFAWTSDDVEEEDKSCRPSVVGLDLLLPREAPSTYCWCASALATAVNPLRFVLSAADCLYIRQTGRPQGRGLRQEAVFGTGWVRGV